jgi:hypothetical protein
LKSTSALQAEEREGPGDSGRARVAVCIRVVSERVLICIFQARGEKRKKGEDRVVEDSVMTICR